MPISIKECSEAIEEVRISHSDRNLKVPIDNDEAIQFGAIKAWEKFESDPGYFSNKEHVKSFLYLTIKCRERDLIRKLSTRKRENNNIEMGEFSQNPRTDAFFAADLIWRVSDAISSLNDLESRLIVWKFYLQNPISAFPRPTVGTPMKQMTLKQIYKTYQNAIRKLEIFLTEEP